ncbi:MAG: sterol desaturase family protein [Hyphomicrobiaceae bacterium]|nr:sterol desaturase family protein [Hyphomicrobiaceae bacterium]
MTTFGWVSDTVLRLGAFTCVLVALIALEFWTPRRPLSMNRLQRWTTNLSIIALGSIVVRILAVVAGWIAVPLVAMTAAVYAETLQFGLLHQISLPSWGKILLAVIVLDFAVWLQHVVSHVWTPLWQLHKMHHADRDFDATTALRFHPIEIGLSMLYKVVWVMLLGLPAAGVLVFEVVLNATAMFNHSNWAMPLWLDRWVRILLVTPDMHRVHHSVHKDEHDTNFGFCLSVWDRMFRSYTAQPRDGHVGMTLGLVAYQNEQPAELAWSLTLPFKGRPVEASGSSSK